MSQQRGATAAGVEVQQQQEQSTQDKGKRNSGLFSLFRWLKWPSKESMDGTRCSAESASRSRRCSSNSDTSTTNSSSSSLSSLHSAGTVASFAFVPAAAYQPPQACPGASRPPPSPPETDTYRARLRMRDLRRERDKGLTLRRKYNLYLQRDTVKVERKKVETEEESTKSLPLFSRAMETVETEKAHRRTNSESSKVKRAGAYVHVKGKRRAPQPPGQRQSLDLSSTSSLKRKKRTAPPPPEKITENNKVNVHKEEKQTPPEKAQASGSSDIKAVITTEKIVPILQIDKSDTEVICNDSLRLDHGVLKPAKEQTPSENSSEASRSTSADKPVSPRPWYKRNTSRDTKKDNNGKPAVLDRLPEVQFSRNSSLDLTLDDKPEKKKEEKRKSGLTFLTNISELDREASEIVNNREYDRNNLPDLSEMPHFMRPKINSPETLATPKRRSARDLIAKFNAITNVTKVTVFGASHKERFFGKQTSLDETKRQETMLESHRKLIDEIDKKKEEKSSPLMKSESAGAVKKPETPKQDRKSWKCPKCNLENEYWRIICHVCSAIKPYFDDFASSSKSTENKITETKTASPLITKRELPVDNGERFLERSKTQIGFSALATYNSNKKTEPEETKSTAKYSEAKKEEKEKLKKMLIEMKNSLPKRKSHILLKQNSRTSIIMENPEEQEHPYEEYNQTIDQEKTAPKETKDNPTISEEKTQEQKVAEILIGSKTTIYENIKMRKTDNPKPLKVSSAAQTSAVVKKLVPQNTLANLIENHAKKYEPMRPKDFEDIYSDKDGKSAARIYANLAQHDELSLFFNVPKRFTEAKNNLSKVSAAGNNNTDTLEINRLLRRLETAIAKGELTEAAIFAKELAQLKVNCSVIRQKPQVIGGAAKKGFQVEMYVEDKVSHRGPFPIDVTANQTVAELKKQIERDFEIPVAVQRWILGKELVTDENATIKDHHITEGCPVFLYLVAPENKPSLQEQKNSSNKKQDTRDIPSTSAGPSKRNSIIDHKIQVNGATIPELTKEHFFLPRQEEKKDKPKIVNVIPKSSEQNPKSEIIRIVPVKLEEQELKPPAKAFVTKEEIVIKEEVIANPAPAEKHLQPSTSEPQKNVVETKPSAPIPSQATIRTQTQSTDEPTDDKTLTPAQEWECHLCTLLNPNTSNICAVCATVRIHRSVPRKSPKQKRAPQPQPKEEPTYLQLVHLDNADLVSNVEPFECVICFLEIPPNEGVTLRECLHQFCRPCLANTIEFSEEAEVQCPYKDNEYSCNLPLQDREIKSLVSKAVYEQHLAKSVTQAENQMEKTFHCKTPDCKGWCIFEDNVNEFRCPVCEKINCLTCQVIHMGLNCKQYQERMNEESEVDDNAKRTKEMLNEMVSKGEALACPVCQVVLMKKWGCDWVRCSMCKTEICWVTRGTRWGAGGRGDTSGGCKCGVNGVKCHPKCNYCH